MNFLSKIWNRAAESIAIRSARISFFTAERNRLLEMAKHNSAPGITDKQFFSTPLIVSLTTHSRRLFETWLSIESIMQGSVLPNRIILWLNEDMQSNSIPEILFRQQKRGLEIHYTKDIGPYTKIIPALTQFPDAHIVTIDDDMIYPYDTLELLVNAQKQNPNSICANRVLSIVPNKDYKVWKETIPVGGDMSQSLFFEAVCGVIYPPKCFSPEVFNDSEFLSICPTADDVWLNCMARLNHTPIVSSNYHYLSFPLIVNEEVQDSALWRINYLGKKSANDIQLGKVMDRYGISF